MHTNDPDKDKALFREEIDAILNGSSAYHRPENPFDFTGFVFPEAEFERTTFTKQAVFRKAVFVGQANFSGARFTEEANFSGARFTEEANFSVARFTQAAYFFGATFTEAANFSGATFTQEAYFSGVTFTEAANFFEATFTQEAYFFGARFTGAANFSGATFTQEAYFSGVTFTEAATFSEATFTEAANFRAAHFEQPARVRFYQVNKGSAQGLRARFVNCHVEGVQFEDVNWHQEGWRMVLQDELDVQAGQEGKRKQHELVSTAYRRLVNNFEKVRAYDLAEDCYIGAMEMKRLDPAHFLFARRLGHYYEKWRWLGWLGEHLSAVYLYRLASFYGSSYQRAFWVLVVLLLGFATAFGTMTQVSGSLSPWAKVWEMSKAGLLHSLEVATFQRPTSGSAASRFLGVVETIFVPVQAALLLLALRRRFRR